VDQGQFSDPDLISGTHQKENVKFADKLLTQLSQLYPLGLAEILAIMSVSTFKLAIILYLSRNMP
jgi:hypothetical protein